ncbi:hypothetical protein B7C42_03119 [Nocardia cerradoensis]|uniref:Transposase DDE domain-containing protein n=1 Tax=Nocardia cerradoensis TaxID=85688 RepID=A0A231H8G2_9NOCA|nr:hypothetical protein B7C42_03119 [Nocardia cerradoensis]
MTYRYPLFAFIDHGDIGTGEPAAVMLRPGNAGSNTAADHMRVLHESLAQLPWASTWRIGRRVLVRTDSGGEPGSVMPIGSAPASSLSVASAPPMSTDCAPFTACGHCVKID